jgi:hypothetical protein
MHDTRRQNAHVCRALVPVRSALGVSDGHPRSLGTDRTLAGHTTPREGDGERDGSDPVPEAEQTRDRPVPVPVPVPVVPVTR